MYGVWKALRGPAFKILYSSFTISLCCSCKEMKEAEVVKRKKKKKAGGGESQGRIWGVGGVEGPTGCRRTQHHLHQPLNALSWSWDSASTHRSTRTEEGLLAEFKGEKVQNMPGKGQSPVACGAEWGWAAGPSKPGFRRQSPKVKRQRGASVFLSDLGRICREKVVCLC